MTNEEAISVLKNTAWIGTDKKVGEVEKAIMMDVEALKAQDATDTNVGSNDLISRQAAIDAVQHAFDRETLLNSFVRKVAVDALKTMPSAHPQHWIDKTDPEWDGEWGDWQCPHCGAMIMSMAINLNGVYLYCPKCGEAVRGGEDGTT